MTEKKQNPQKRGRKPRPANELRLAYVTVRCRDALYSATLAACKAARDQLEGTPAPAARLPGRLAASLERFAKA